MFTLKIWTSKDRKTSSMQAILFNHPAENFVDKKSGMTGLLKTCCQFDL